MAWHGRLLSSPADIAIDFILLIAIPLAYFSVSNTTVSSSDNGPSPYYLLFSALYNNIQFSHTIQFAAYAYPDEKEPLFQLFRERKLEGREVLGPLLGLLQVWMLWMCSIVRATFLGLQSSDIDKGGVIISAVVFLHAVITVVPSISVIHTNRTPRNSVGLDFSARLTIWVNTWVALFCVVAQLIPQYVHMGYMNEATTWESRWALLLSILLQGLLVVLVGWRWLLRMGMGTRSGRPESEGEAARSRLSPRQWLNGAFQMAIAVYLSAWLPVNYFIHGFGCAVLFWCFV